MKTITTILMSILLCSFICSSEVMMAPEFISVEVVLDKAENIISVSEGKGIKDAKSNKIILKVGKWKTFIKPNLLVSEAEYDNNGKLDGTQITYSPTGSGKLYIVVVYKGGLLNGKSWVYNPVTSVVMEERQYCDDLLDGESIYYNESGTVKERKLFLKGREITKESK